MGGHNQYAGKQNERGHTLLETMLSLIILLAIVSIVPHFYFVLFSTDEQVLYAQEVGIFFEQADKELQGSISAVVQSDKLYLEQQNGTIISYETNGNRIIRKVDGKGFEVILQHVQSVTFTSTNTTVSITVQIGEQSFTHQSILYQPYANQ
ncbi:competence type IV pilus minor pilin ComGF [Pseudalkalibacillus berkeleyi]|uniref:ComGF family competence protein n=1 Tax=Pseudalkalibacillus berkeleyi TaxID=1069813 RepID=A0ABS9GYR4_9BACL|nr:competence type IV pilus minor pilin ComGF [Pseudalkalibacillus berkeleyi]MCF6137884.1 ComGF family competence protein [Pseudalkalibacillus berkeleyi]